MNNITMLNFLKKVLIQVTSEHRTLSSLNIKKNKRPANNLELF